MSTNSPDMSQYSIAIVRFTCLEICSVFMPATSIRRAVWFYKSFHRSYRVERLSMCFTTPDPTIWTWHRFTFARNLIWRLEIISLMSRAYLCFMCMVCINFVSRIYTRFVSRVLFTFVSRVCFNFVTNPTHKILFRNRIRCKNISVILLNVMIEK